MALQPGTTLGPYEILSLIGAGGMGEVYKARDTRLERSIAVKVLAPALATDADFRARFAREAKAVSALNHAHICGLYDIGRERDTDYLVLELLEGETLAARLERGALPLSQVLRFGIEIADALEAAHRHGIVHRDLKPGNVMLTPAGTKLLDFGLAKNTIDAPGQALTQLTTSPQTITAEGTILGTLPYMAPEQIQGLPADARTDLFALGAILHEMATGRRAFEATTQPTLIGKILETKPPLVSSLAPLTPPALDHVVQGCLAKAPVDRWQTAHDVKLQLRWIEAHASHIDGATPIAVTRQRTAWVPWVVAAVATALAATTLLRSSRVVTPAPPARFELVLPPAIERADYDRGAISPDGKRFVFEATVDGRHQLVLRDLASTAFVVLEGTDGALDPFWSPDSRWVAFFVSSGHLKRVPLMGGPAREIADRVPILNVPIGSTWRDGVILFAPADGRIYRVAEAGGTATAVETGPWKPGQRRFAFPRFLPDGRHFLVTVVDDPAVYVASLDAPGMRQVMDDGAPAVYAAGHLFYSRRAGVFARPFDAERLEFSGAEMQLTQRAGEVSVSDDGTIAYTSGGALVSRLTWFDRSGQRTGTLGNAEPYDQVVLSPRGHHATVVRGDAHGNGWDLWDVDLASGIFSRLTTDPADDADPSWAPDEHALAFTSWRTGRAAVFVKDLTSGKEEPLVPFHEAVVVDQWTPDGRFIIFRTFGKAVYAMPLSGKRTPRMLVDTPFTEDEVHVSPDGRWVAFHADESGRWEVYVAAFPTFTSKRQISSGGGVEPQWRADGRELFYLAPDSSMMSVRVEARPEFTASPPTRLFATNIAPDPNVPRYAVTADGRRFLGLERTGDDQSFTFLLNWLNAKPANGSGPVR
jgi:eukaryotic-like serine/threonine-protein kinase